MLEAPNEGFIPGASEGPEPIRMPPELEEVLDAAILPQAGHKRGV